MLHSILFDRQVPESGPLRGGSVGDPPRGHRSGAATTADPSPEPDDDVRTVAKLKIEIDSDTATEKEAEQEMEDVDETDQVEINERRPVMVNDNAFIIDPKLAHARLRMQVPYYPHVKDCNSVDSILTASSYHGIYGRQLHAQELEGKLAMVRLAIPQDAEQFQQGMR